MTVPIWVWGLTLIVLLVLFAVDLFLVDRHPHEVSMGEATRWVVCYLVLAGLFCAGLAYFAGGRYAGEFFAGYLTEYSLSVDNLFVFVVIMAAFGVPKIHEHKVLLFGVLAALFLRGAFIGVGAAAIAAFEWIFYLFGAFLVGTAYKLAVSGSGSEQGYTENIVLRWTRKILPMTAEYHGARTVVKVDGKRRVTPMLVVMLAIGTTDLLFALDSIPAIFGLTKEPFLVFTANAFALMGLRQLYFLIGGLLTRLVYLSKGLAVILGFIGVKLILEAMEGSGVDWAPHIGIPVSLGVIAGVLAVTVLASLIKVRHHPGMIRQLPSAPPD